jgi:DNA-binding CsgD family transcriptional regulator
MLLAAGNDCVEIEQLWDIMSRGPGEDLRTLQRISRKTGVEPLPTAVRAVEALLSGDVAGGSLLMQQAIRRSSLPEAAYLSDILVTVFANRGDFEAANRLLERGMNVERLVPCFVASRAVLAAFAGDVAESRRYSTEALRMLDGVEDALIYGRIVQRLALAAFNRSDFDEAVERALCAVRWSDRAGAHRVVCSAYSILYAVADGVHDDKELARYYLREILAHATACGDVFNEKFSVLCLLSLAADMADMAEVESQWETYHRKRRSEQFLTENFHVGVVAMLRSGWQGRFDAVATSVEALKRSSGRTLSEKALCDAFEAVTKVASWDLRKARALVRLVISETIASRRDESLYDRRQRRIARALAALVCLCIGDTVRGRRALSGRSDLASAFGDLDALIDSDGVKESASPPSLRGYVRFLNCALTSSFSVRPRGNLTLAELEVLRALSDGTTIAKVAMALGKSPKTVRCQVASIYAKLGASNRTQALKRAIELRLLHTGPYAVNPQSTAAQRETNGVHSSKRTFARKTA